MKPTLVTLDQNTKEWVEWRDMGLGASDAPVVMMDSANDTPFKLWQRKLGIRKAKADNQYMARGRKVETDARDAYSKATGEVIPPACFEHPAFPHLRASLDGCFPVMDPDTQVEPELTVELKSPEMVGDHLTAREGQVPAKYYAQCQMQIAVSQSKKHQYCSFWHGDLAIVEVAPDWEYIEEELIPAMNEMWDMILCGEFRVPEEAPAVDLSSNPEWADAAQRYKDYEAMVEHAQNLLETAKGKLVRLARKHRLVQGAGLQAEWKHTIRRAYQAPAVDSWSLGIRQIPAKRVD